MATVFDYGAKGDGVTDDSAAFAAALNASANGAGPILIPGATYAIASTISYTLNTSTARPWGFIGEGARLLSKITNGSDLMQITAPFNGTNYDVRYLQMINFQVFGSGGFQTTGKEGNGIKIIAQDGVTTAIYNCLFHQLTFDSLGGSGLVLDGNIFETSVIGCNFQRCTDGLICAHDSNTVASGGHEGICSSISITDCMFIQNNNVGLHCTGFGPSAGAASEVDVKGGYFRQQGSYGALWENGMAFGRGMVNVGFENNCWNTAPGSPSANVAHVKSANDARMVQCSGFLNGGGAMSLLSVYTFGKTIMRQCTHQNEGGPALPANMGFAFIDGQAGSVFLAYECGSNLFSQSGTATNWRCYNCSGTAPSPQNNLNNTGTTGTI